MVADEYQLSKEDFDHEFEKALDMSYSIGMKLYRGSEDDAADFVQSLYPFALKQLSKFAGRSAFSTWLYRIAWNFGLEDLRRKKRLLTDSIEGLDIAAEQNEPEFDEQEIGQLRKHISQLHDGYRIPLILLFYENMSYADISAITGVKEGTLKANVHRAKNLIRQKLGKG